MAELPTSLKFFAMPSLVIRDVKMSVLCLTYRISVSVLSILSAYYKMIMVIVVLSADWIYPEIPIGRPAWSWRGFSELHWVSTNYSLNSRSAYRNPRGIGLHWNYVRWPFVCLLFILSIFNCLSCLSVCLSVFCQIVSVFADQNWTLDGC
jgi:hypothetical protein